MVLTVLVKVCSHLTLASTSPSKFNIASMETQTHRMGLNPFLTFYIDALRPILDVLYWRSVKHWRKCKCQVWTYIIVCSHCPTPTLTQTLIPPIVTVLNGIVVLVQCEHLHTILSNLFFIGVCIGLSVGQCEHTIKGGIFAFSKKDKKNSNGLSFRRTSH